MAMRIDSTTDDPADVAQALEADGEEATVEETETESEAEETQEETETEEEPEESKETEDAEEETEEEKPAAKAAPKEEETQDDETDEKVDWNKLPKGLRNLVKKLREDRRNLKDRLSKIEHKQAEEPPRKPADAKADDTEESKEPVNYSGQPEPKLEDFDKDGDPYKAYAKAMAIWAAKEERAKADFERQIREQVDARNAQKKEFNARSVEAAQLYSDYDDVLEEASTLMASPLMQEVIYASEVGPHILYHLANNPDECQDIFDMPPKAQVRAMGRLEARIEATVETLKGKAAKSTETPKKNKSSAPPPTTPLKGSPPKTKTSDDLAGSEDRIVEPVIKLSREYMKKRDEERRGRYS